MDGLGWQRKDTHTYTSRYQLIIRSLYKNHLELSFCTLKIKILNFDDCKRKGVIALTTL